MTEEEFDDLERMLNDIKEMPEAAQMSDWEQYFMDDQYKRVEQYGRGTRMSDKQIGIIRRIHERLPL